MEESKKRERGGVVYHNKDVLFKVLSEAYKEKSFSAYGIDLPHIKEVLPTNLPKMWANEKEPDNLFLLTDGTYVIVEYESQYRRKDMAKYLNYSARIIERYIGKGEIKLRLIVIYTGDVLSADSVLEANCLTLRVEQVFLCKMDGEGEYTRIRGIIEKGLPLCDEDVMRLIILPLTQRGMEKKQKMLENIINLSESIRDEGKRRFVVSGVVIASDKFARRQSEHHQACLNDASASRA